jgi:hypothetical protein
MKITTAINDEINAAMAACQRLEDHVMALDLAVARHGHSLRRCRELAGDIQALLEAATDD